MPHSGALSCVRARVVSHGPFGVLARHGTGLIRNATALDWASRMASNDVSLRVGRDAVPCERTDRHQKRRQATRRRVFLRACASFCLIRAHRSEWRHGTARTCFAMPRRLVRRLGWFRTPCRCTTRDAVPCERTDRHPKRRYATQRRVVLRACVSCFARAVRRAGTALSDGPHSQSHGVGVGVSDGFKRRVAARGARRGALRTHRSASEAAACHPAARRLACVCKLFRADRSPCRHECLILQGEPSVKFRVLEKERKLLLMLQGVQRKVGFVRGVTPRSLAAIRNKKKAPLGFLFVCFVGVNDAGTASGGYLTFGGFASHQGTVARQVPWLSCSAWP